MKKYTLLGHVFEIQDHAALFLERYVQRIEQHAGKNNISSEILDDIKYSILEKLYRFETPITEKNVMEVANQLGEPEDIFDDTSTNKDEQQGEQKENTLTNFIGRERPIVRGVCYWISKTTTIPVTFVRIAFLLLVFVYGISIWTYPIIALFVPYKDKKQTTGRVGNWFFELIRIVLWVGMIGLLGFLFIGSIALMGFVTLTPSVGNQTIIPWIPNHMYIVGSFVIIAIFVLLIGAVGALFKKKFITKNRALLSTITLIISGIVTAGTIYRTVLGIDEIPQKTISKITSLSGSTIQTGSTSDHTITINVQGEFIRRGFPFFDNYNDISSIRALPSQDADFHIEESISMRAPNEKQLQKNTEIVNYITISGSNKTIDIQIPKNHFSQIVPIAFSKRYITIYIPTNITFAIHSTAVRRQGELNSLYYVREKIENGRKYYGNCTQDSTYSYDMSGGKYVCNSIQRYEANKNKYKYNDDYTSDDNYDNRSTSGSIFVSGGVLSGVVSK